MRRWVATMATAAGGGGSAPTSASAAAAAAAASTVYYDRILRKVTAALSPSAVELVDESADHAGHAGNPGTGETHFRLSVTSDAFTGVSRVGRHRRVYALLSEELAERVHALSITTRTPAEAAAAAAVAAAAARNGGGS